MKFKVGDKVIVNEETSYKIAINRIGEVVDLETEPGYIGIKIKGFDGHDLYGKLDSEEGYWIEDYALDIYKNSNKSMY